MWRFGSTKINSAAADESSRSLHSRQVLFRNNGDSKRMKLSFLVKIVLMTQRIISARGWRKM